MCPEQCQSLFEGRAALQGVCLNQRHLLCPVPPGDMLGQELSPSCVSSAEEGEHWGSSTDPHEQTSGARTLL